MGKWSERGETRKGEVVLDVIILAAALCCTSVAVELSTYVMQLL